MNTHVANMNPDPCPWRDIALLVLWAIFALGVVIIVGAHQ